MKKNYPWRIDTGDMQGSVLLMCKLMFIMLLVHGLHTDFTDPFIPFFSFFDTFRQFPGFFEYSLKITFLLSGLLLLFNFKVRWMAVLLGVTIITALLASKPFFRNHIFITGCAFLLAGLSDKDKDPWLLYVQLSIVYFGALINKVGQIDWWSGQFMHNWLAEAFDNAPYDFLSNLLPERWMAKLFSWGSMLMELIIGILLLLKRRQGLAVWLILIFHSTLFAITMTRFGHFFDDILIYLLVFLNWPKSEFQVNYQAGKLKWLRTFLPYLDWNAKQKWEASPLSKNIWLEVHLPNKTEINEVGLRTLLLYSPGFYMAIFLIDSGTRFLFTNPLLHFISVAFYLSGILFFLPIRWRSTPKKATLEI